MLSIRIALAIMLFAFLGPARADAQVPKASPGVPVPATTSVPATTPVPATTSVPDESAAVATPAGAVRGDGNFDDEQIHFFEKKVRPLLASRCFNCHSATTNSRGGLRTDDRNGLLAGGDRGPALVPGDPDNSLLLQAVRRTHATLKMPPDGKLEDDEIAILTQWIRDGVAWPRTEVEVLSGEVDPAYEQLRKEHWAWQPLQAPPPGPLHDEAWPRDKVDRYVLATLEARDLAPVGDADPRSWARRASFDLTGLPPAPSELASFVADWNAAASTTDAEGRQASLRERWVDRLLASPAFGERWGRHWLDVARYGESTGSSRNVPYPHAWRYRDYVIDAFNADKPYDRFLTEQIAGDLLPADSPEQQDELLVATGFLALGVCDVNQRFKVRFVMDNIDEQIDTVTRATLALTVSCARCHDHKFDPVPTADYYALAGICHSSVRCAGVRNKMGGGGLDYYDTEMLLALKTPHVPVADLDRQIAEAESALAAARKELAAVQGNTEQGDGPEEDREKQLREARNRVRKMQTELLTLNDPALRGPVALGVRDGAVIGDIPIRIRGEAEALGPVAPRGFLTLLDVPEAPAIDAQQSGRLQLAQWLVHPQNPLASRVMVNRIWKHLFGAGLVASVDNFGVTGDRPTHPELLDHLALRFMEQGWSVKKIIRALVLTRTYQLSSEATEANLAADPSNRLHWRHSPRRLDAEEIRDAMLMVAGTLDAHRPAGSLAQHFKVVELRNNGAEAARLSQDAVACRHRSVYLPLVRGLTPRSLAAFDFAEQGMVTGARDVTTVATQALYLLNDPFVREQAVAFAERILSDADLDDAGRIASAFELALGRSAEATEIEQARQFLADYAGLAAEDAASPDPSEAWASLAHALLAAAEFRYLR